MTRSEIDTEDLLAAVEADAKLVAKARRRLALNSLGLIAARIRADHPTALYMTLSHPISMRTLQGWTEVGRVWVTEADGSGEWCACLDDDARDDVDRWCAHIGADVDRLLPEVWHQLTGLTVVSLDAVTAALSNPAGASS